MGTASELKLQSQVLHQPLKMIKVALLLLPLIVAAHAAPEARFTCEECVREMHGLAAMVKMGAIPIHDYLRDNYCPTLESTADQHFCEDSLSKYYIGMLFGVVEHYFVDGAVHVCQTMGVCDAREYTCEECVQGLEWVEAYLEDPIMTAEFVVYLQQNFCTNDMRHCHENVANHFPAMHAMAMEKFFIPREICNQEPVCTGEQPNKPPQ